MATRMTLSAVTAALRSALFILFLALSFFASASVPARAERLVGKTGIVEWVGNGVVRIRGQNYDVSKAVFKNTSGKYVKSSAVETGARVDLHLRGDKAVVVIVYPRAMVE